MDRDLRGLPVGIFDSGVGGVSVLKEMVKILPTEDFLYFADSKNAPYGTKEFNQVVALTLEAADFLVKKGIKVLVVACNTATSVAIELLRKKLTLPVIGMEPAVKPALEAGHQGKIMVMATPVTLQQEKFHRLLHRFDDSYRVIPLPCPGLVELIEQGVTGGEELNCYLAELFQDIPLQQISVVVLGCTHYVFIKNGVQQFFAPGTNLIDGNCGTAKQLKNMLEQQGLAKISNQPQLSGAISTGSVKFYTSGNEERVLSLCRQLFAK